MAIVGCCPMDKGVGCEALPMDRLVGGKSGVGAKELNVPCGIPVERRGGRELEEVMVWKVNG